MTTNEELLAQDDIDSLLAGADKKEEPAKKEEMTTNKELLGQDDIDALIAQADNKQEPDGLPGKPLIKSTRRFEQKSDEDVRIMSVQLYNSGFLVRDKGVKVIWNALGTLPMNSGININIQGVEYISLGILHVKNLVVRYKE